MTGEGSTPYKRRPGGRPRLSRVANGLAKERGRADFRSTRQRRVVYGRNGAPPIMAVHTVLPGDTLRYIAIQFYNSASEERWKAIYEANKELIGEDPSLIRPGQVLKIPSVPE